jgi:D-alanyl-D-alanine endopeptidase (penicillin-binding protein 7)
MKILNNFYERLGHWPNIWLIIALVITLVSWPQMPTSSATDLGSLPKLPLPGVVADYTNWEVVPTLDELELSSLSALVVKLPSGEIVGALEPELELPIASLTKLMTSVITLESKINLDSPVTITATDNSLLSSPYIKAGDKISLLQVKDGEQVTLRNLLGATLVGSANNAASALASFTGKNQTEFVRLMNERAAVLGMSSTYYTEATGLDPANISTAYDLAIIGRYAWQNKLLREFSGKKQINFTTLDGKPHKINNTNSLLLQPQINFTPRASKTGYLEEAGYNLIFQFRLRRGGEYLLVLLNAPTLEDRSADVLKVVSWLLLRT